MKFKICVLVCIYEPDSYLFEQIESIVNQTLPVSWIYIFDDSESDNYEGVVDRIFSKLSFENYSYHRGKCLGAKVNFLDSITKIDCDYLFLSDQDDVWIKEKVKKFISVFTERECENVPLIVYSDAFVTDENLNIINTSFFEYQKLSSNVFDDDSILFKNCIQGGSCCINKSLIKLVKESILYIDYDEIVVHDWYLAILSKYFGDQIFVNESLMLYRQHGNNQIGAKTYFENMFEYLSNPISKLQYIYTTIKQFKKIEQLKNHAYFCDMISVSNPPKLSKINRFKSFFIRICLFLEKLR